MRTTHATVHHEPEGERRTFTRTEDHRTDGRDRRSTPGGDLYPGPAGKAQRAASPVADHETRFHPLAQWHVAEVDAVAVHLEHRGFLSNDAPAAPAKRHLGDGPYQ